MAVDNNPFVIKSVFEPQSFDEMVKPLMMAAAAYKEQEAKLEDMTDKASALEWIANQDPNSQTAALYRDMSDKIKGIRDDIMMNGFHGGVRTNILDTRKIYSANSSEITRRYQDMVKYRERMEQLYDKDNSMVFSPESWNVGIDDFAGGKRPQIKAISGNEIMARGVAVGKRLTSQIFGDGVKGKVAGEQFWEFYQENGMTDAAMKAWLDNNGMGDKFPMAKQVVDSVFNSFSDFGDRDKQYLKDRFIEGVYSGSVYDRKVDYQQNRAFIDPATEQEIAESKARVATEAAAAKREEEDWLFASGRTRKKVWVSETDSNGETKIVPKWVQVNISTGEYMFKDIKSNEVSTQKIPDPKKKEENKEEKKEEKRVTLAVTIGRKNNVKRENTTNGGSKGRLISPDNEDYNKYIDALAQIHHKTVEDLKQNYDVFQDGATIYGEPIHKSESDSQEGGHRI